MNQPCNHIKALLSGPLRPAEPVTCFRLQEVLCDLTSILQKQRGGRDDRKVNGEQGGVSRPQSECVALAGDQRLVQMKLRYGLTPETRLPPLCPSHFPRIIIQARIRWPWSPRRAHGSQRAAPVVSVSKRLNIFRHRLVTHLTMSILLNEPPQALDLESRIHL